MLWNLLVWLVLGGIIGWIASLVMRTDARQGITLDIAVGVSGAFVGALTFYRGELHRPVEFESFIVALLGSILLLSLTNLFRRGHVR
ncbi:GlsB/YeaQ/YmgE family stress response membrane protein [Sphingosinicella sp. CPCC 101087]|uniref:GlsB/YeaQ/YmgE family stress response membrane protein n=1 Tax=Sphingosinicella sp. CPCC 101087 TaxID=2497754 RepID=UPI00101C93AD|nr:GlsB/YeaQ/YmgE family stress response membrane protein [Sphingosinicella sp. CPCC 101087]